MIGMPSFHSKIRAAATTVFFLAFFRLADFFSSGFSINAENIQLGG